MDNTTTVTTGTTATPLPPTIMSNDRLTITVGRLKRLITLIEQAEKRLAEANHLINQMTSGKDGATAGALASQAATINEATLLGRNAGDQIAIIADELASL